MSNQRRIQGLIESLAEEYVPEAVQALVACGLSAVEPLVNALWHTDMDPYAHDTFAEALSAILLAHHYRQATDWLVRLLEHENADVRRRVAEVLGIVGDQRAVPILRIALYDRNDSVQHAAAFAVIQLAYGTLTVETLRAALYDQDSHVRYLAVRSLEFLNADEPLFEAARNDYPLVRQIAIYYMGRVQSTAGFELLIDALQDPDDGVCLGAIWSLGQVGDTRAVPALEPLVYDQSEKVARAAHDALLKLGSHVS